jgi:alpha-mannosidase
MDRRNFLKSSGTAGLAWIASGGLAQVVSSSRLLAAPESERDENPNWANETFKPKAEASSYFADPPWGYRPENIFNKDEHIGWEAGEQLVGAWVQIDFPTPCTVSELWILGRPLAYDVVGSDPYLATFSRTRFYAPPRRIRCALSDGSAVTAELRDANWYQIVRFPGTGASGFMRIQIEDVWGRPGVLETGIAKVKIFPQRHEPGFEVDVHAMYDVHDGKPVQTATLEIINPEGAIDGARLTISQKGERPVAIPLETVPGRAVSHQPVWIPAPFSDAEMEFKIVNGTSVFGSARSLRIPSFRSHFEGGAFAIHCTCHNDLGWLDTQEKTGDFRSERIILPALKLLKEYPEFRYSMESTVYLMEFLERHPEKREEVAGYMRARRFAWGASYVQCLEVHVGPEKLARQFYLGRRWLRKHFPGVDTQTYFKTDPPGLTVQMPQILKKAGIKYLIQGRMPFGFYWWQGLDGSTIFTYGLTATPLVDPLDAKSNEGWLKFAEQREYYYRPRQLPQELIYDYWFDYLVPQPELPPYVQSQNEAMKRFAASWNDYYKSNPGRQISPPRMTFTSAEEFFDEFTKHELDITTLCGDWPLNWAYYDEPSHRAGLLAGRLAHNRLLTAERIYAALSLSAGFADYPQETFDEAWRANCWPDHGWGGNKGPVTDAAFVASYEKSKQLADQLVNEAGTKLAKTFKASPESSLSLVVFNPLNWERTDLTEVQFELPAGWAGFSVLDEAGESVPYEIVHRDAGSPSVHFVFVARAVPSLGYRAYALKPAPHPEGFTALAGDVAENRFFKVIFGPGGIKSLYDKRLDWEVYKTGKFDAGEVIQLTALGFAWDDPQDISMEDFDQTSRHPYPFKSFARTPVRVTAVREAEFQHFRLRQLIHLYHSLDRVDIELELLDWDGQKERELRVVFPINLDDARITYEAPFGKVELGEDELDFSLLPSDPLRTWFENVPYGAKRPLAYREAINWIDASDAHYLGHGCLLASDTTVHLFRDDTDHPLSCPLLQHVLLCTRKSQSWNPLNWFTQKGTHRYRLSVMPHADNWRARYRGAMGFNYPLVAFASSDATKPPQGTAAPSESFLHLEPANLVITTLKKGEDGDHLALRFYEAEGFECEARLRFSRPILQAWRANLIEDKEELLHLKADGSLRLAVKPWEIMTIMFTL